MQARRVYRVVDQIFLSVVLFPLQLISAGYGASVIEMLLMVSGDVERNPGPTSKGMHAIQ